MNQATKLPITGGSNSLRFLSFVFCSYFLFLFSVSTYVYSLDVPPQKGYVNDYGEMMSPATRTQIGKELNLFEQSDATHVAILTISSLEGETIENFSIKVAETWKMAQRYKDNWVLMVAASQDRRIRIEVGKGLETKFSNVTATQIIDLTIRPRFQRKDFDGGFVAGTKALIEAARGEFKAAAAKEPAPAKKREEFKAEKKPTTFKKSAGSVKSVIQIVLGVIIGIALIDIVISSFFMMVGAKMAGIQNATFGKSVLAALASAIVTWLVTLVLSVIPVIGSVLGFFIGLLFALLVIRGVYTTTLGKAFLAWVFNILAKLIALVIAAFTFASAIFSFFG